MLPPFLLPEPGPGDQAGRPLALEPPAPARTIAHIMEKPAAILTRVLGSGPQPHEILGRLAGRPGAFLLESALRPGRRARWSYLGAEPFMTLAAKGRRTWTVERGRRSTCALTAFNELGRTLEGLRAPRPPETPPAILNRTHPVMLRPKS